MWGWGEDPGQQYHRWVLYVDLPTGQASFHTLERFGGPPHPRGWDRNGGRSADHIISYATGVLTGKMPLRPEPAPTYREPQQEKLL
jgi:hypothetical protein